MFRVNVDRFYDDNPQDAVGGTNAPSVARRYSRGSWTAQVNHTAVLEPEPPQRSARSPTCNGDPVTLWEAQTLSTTYTRAGSVPFTIGQSRVSDLFSHQAQFSDTLSWSRGKHYLRFGGSVDPSHLRRHRQRARHRDPRHVHVPEHDDGAVRSVDAGRRAELHAADQLRHQQLRADAVALHRRSCRTASACSNDLTLDLGLRYDRQTLTDATNELRAARRLRLASGRRFARSSIRGGYGMYYTQIRSNAVAGYLVNGLDGLTTYTATPGQLGFPTCLTGPCLPLSFDPRTLPPSQLPARDITIRAGRARLLPGAVREVRAELRPAAELSRQARESAQPGGLDRRRARGRARACSSAPTTCTSTGPTSIARSI